MNHRTKHPMLLSLLFIALMNYAQFSIAQHDQEHIEHSQVDSCEIFHFAKSVDAKESKITSFEVFQFAEVFSTVAFNASSLECIRFYQSRAPPVFS